MGGFRLRRFAFVLAVLGLALPSVGAQPPPPDIVWASHIPLAGTTLLFWGPVAEADSYIIYRGASPDSLEPIGETSATYWLDENAPSHRIYYGVSAVNEGGASSQSSVGVPGGKGCYAYVTGTSPQADLTGCVRF